jgi:hypothetical protein
MNKAIPDGGRSVKCARCGHQWRMLPPEEPEELIETLEPEPDPAEAAASALRHSPAADFGASAAGYGHEPSSTSFTETAAHYEQSASAGFSEDTAQYEPGHYDSPASEPEPGPDPAGPSWEIRRGNLAAALASMGDTADPQDTGPYAEPDQQYDPETGAWPVDTAGYRIPQSEELHSPAADHTVFADESAAPAPVSFSDHLDAAGAGPSWMREERAQRATGDAESSVRQVFRSALDEPDAAGPDEFDPHGGESAISHPVFTDPDTEEPSLGANPEWPPRGIAAEDASLAPASPPGDASQQAFSDRWKTFAASGRLAEADADAALTADGQQDAENFENDIAGIFRQQMQAKRSFGHAPRARTAGDGFTDYDMESSQAAAMADDRYMADSPLDADAAALQAALEGSLRARHTEESRGGVGGLALAAAWAVFLSVLSGVMLAFINFREDIVVALPGMGELYRAVGLGVEEQQIDFGKVNYRWTVADGKPMIEVTGQIVNMTDREIAVPRVLINVLDKESGDPVKATATLRSDPLAARETADFTLEFISPSKSISQIELAFAETNN